MPKTAIWRSLASWVFPVSCLGCGQEGDWWCPDCAKALAWSRPEQCVICRKASLDGICDRCRQETKIDGAVALFDYHQPIVRRLVSQIKYASLSDGLTFFAQMYRRKIIARLAREDFTASFVPLERHRQAERGFNQAELLANLVAGDLFPITPLLTKVVATAAQAKLDRAARLKNLKGSVRLTTKSPPEAVLLFDDVITTGATLATGAKLLKKAGTRTVWAVTIAHD